MKPVRKRFDRALYEAYDTKAKEALHKHLLGRGHEVEPKKEDYYVDVVSTKAGNTYFNEAEVKLAWEGDWPTDWAEIRIPERKTRLLEKYKSEKGFLNFYIFDKNLEQVWRIRDTSLTKERLREAKGRYIQKGEQFYHIPYTEAELIKLDT
jgi:hypothetical protein